MKLFLFYLFGGVVHYKRLLFLLYLLFLSFCWIVVISLFSFFFSVTGAGSREGEGEAVICVVCSRFSAVRLLPSNFHVCIWVFVVDYRGGGGSFYNLAAGPDPQLPLLLVIWFSLIGIDL